MKNVVDMRFMFRGCERFDQPLIRWNVKSLRFAVAMFDYSAMSSSVNGNVMKKWEKTNDLLEYDYYVKDDPERRDVESDRPHRRERIHCVRVIRRVDGKKVAVAKDELADLELNENVDDYNSDDF